MFLHLLLPYCYPYFRLISMKRLHCFSIFVNRNHMEWDMMENNLAWLVMDYYLPFFENVWRWMIVPHKLFMRLALKYFHILNYLHMSLSSFFISAFTFNFPATFFWAISIKTFNTVSFLLNSYCIWQRRKMPRQKLSSERKFIMYGWLVCIWCCWSM